MWGVGRGRGRSWDCGTSGGHEEGDPRPQSWEFSCSGPWQSRAPWEPARLINILLSQGALQFPNHKTQGLSGARIFLTPDALSLPFALPTPGQKPRSSELPCGLGTSVLTVEHDPPTPGLESGRAPQWPGPQEGRRRQSSSSRECFPGGGGLLCAQPCPAHWGFRSGGSMVRQLWVCLRWAPSRQPQPTNWSQPGTGGSWSDLELSWTLGAGSRDPWSYG